MSSHTFTLLEALETIDRSEQFGIPIRIIPNQVNNELRDVLEIIEKRYGVMVIPIPVTSLVDWMITSQVSNKPVVQYVDIIIPSTIDIVEFSAIIQTVIEEFYVFQLTVDEFDIIIGEVSCSKGIYSYSAKKKKGQYLISGEFLTLSHIESASVFAEYIAQQYSYVFGDY